MNLYQKILAATIPYFGDPVLADQFLSRQCEAYLTLNPSDLGPDDLWNLAYWAMVSASKIIGKHRAEALSNAIRNVE